MARTPNIGCLECGVWIYRRPCQIASGPIFCSRLCHGKRFQHPLRNCLACSTEFKHVHPKQKYCSKSCAISHSKKGGKHRVTVPKHRAAVIQRLKLVLIAERGAKCERCPYDKVAILQVHHTVERCHGGPDTAENTELLCPNCHVEEHEARKLVRRAAKLAKKLSMKQVIL